MSPTLKPISLNGTNDNEHIKSEREYLVRIYGHFFAGQFSRQWYGWNFGNWGTSGVQLSSIEFVWELDGSRLPVFVRPEPKPKPAQHADTCDYWIDDDEDACTCSEGS